MKLEAADKKSPSIICVATVTDMVDNRFLVHFDNWDESYDYWWDSFPSLCFWNFNAYPGKEVSTPLKVRDNMKFITKPKSSNMCSDWHQASSWEVVQEDQKLNVILCYLGSFETNQDCMSLCLEKVAVLTRWVITAFTSISGESNAFFWCLSTAHTVHRPTCRQITHAQKNKMP